MEVARSRWAPDANEIVTVTTRRYLDPVHDNFII